MQVPLHHWANVLPCPILWLLPKVSTSSELEHQDALTVVADIFRSLPCRYFWDGNSALKTSKGGRPFASASFNWTCKQPTMRKVMRSHSNPFRNIAATLHCAWILKSKVGVAMNTLPGALYKSPTNGPSKFRMIK
jgi:hypothetical protein